jgi:hypothetical protein
MDPRVPRIASILNNEESISRSRVDDDYVKPAVLKKVHGSINRLKLRVPSPTDEVFTSECMYSAKTPVSQESNVSKFCKILTIK